MSLYETPPGHTRRKARKQIWVYQEDVVELRQMQNVNSQGQREKDADVFHRLLAKARSSEQDESGFRMDKKRGAGL